MNDGGVITQRVLRFGSVSPLHTADDRWEAENEYRGEKKL